MPSAIITTGATVAFLPLLTLTLDPAFRTLLSRLGYSRLVIQHGSIPADFATRLGVPSHGLQIKTFDFVADIRSEINNHDLVISHAGTGSILDALRLNKPLIAVVNPDLLHNHQLDVATELDRQGCLVCCPLPTVELLCAGLERVVVTRFVPLPQPSVVLKEIVEREGGVTTSSDISITDDRKQY